MDGANDSEKLIHIVFYYPKSKGTKNYSIETLFDQVRKSLREPFKPVVKIPKYTSNGVWKRAANIIDAAFCQGDLNHVVGDVHFLVFLLKRKKTILTIHDCIFMQHPSRFLRLIYKWFWLILPIRCAKYVTVVSESTKTEVIKQSKCLPQKILVIPNFVSKQYRYNEKPFNSENPVILHIGTADNKNLERLIQALEGISCTLHIIGRLKSKHLSLLKKYGTVYVNLFDLSAEDILPQYITCDLVAFSSTYEGFGLPIIEAQSVGRPVVTSNVSSMPEVAGNGACFVNPYDVQNMRFGFTNVINDEKYRQKLVENGLRNSKRFSCENTVRQYASLYKQVYELA